MPSPDWVAIIGSALGGGTLVGVMGKWLDKRTLTADTEAERESKRIDARESALDVETLQFRTEIKADLAQVRALHKECESARKADNEACHKARMQDREEVAVLSGQVAFLRDSLDNLHPRGQHARRQTKTRQRTKT